MKLKQAIRPVVLDPLDNTPLSMQLAAAVKKSITRGKYKPGEVLPGIHDLAAQCSTSVKVARRALELLAAEGWTHPQRGIGSVIAERGVNMREAGRILMYVRDTGWSYYCAKLVATMSARLRADGYTITTISASGRSEREPCRRLETMLKERWSLVLLMGGAIGARQLAASSGWPFALIGDGAPLPSCSASNCIGGIQMLNGKAVPDFIRACVRQNVRHLVQFLYAEGGFDVTPMLTKAGITVETVRVPRRNTPEDVSLGAMRAMRNRIGKGCALPDLFLFTDDYLAQGALLTLAVTGIRIPDDVKVVSFANRGLGPIWISPLTRLEVDSVAHGTAVAKGIAHYFKTGMFPSGLVLGSVWKKGVTF